MATVTPNFNWPVPTSTDLVKDGATAIEALGDSIDTSMVDLKGGTTGQILSKASSADMDFTWIANDQGDITGVTAGTGISGGGISGTVTVTNSMATTITTKGDLVPGTGSGTFARLAAGSNGETLVADSSTSTGLRWQGSYPAGKNVLINGLLDIWQRGTTATFMNEAYNAQDRWANYAGATSTFAQETSVIPTNCRYSCKVTIGASAAAVQSSQVIETANAAPYAGQTMTLSGYFQSSATPTINYVVYYSTAVDNPIGGAWTTITATSGGSGTAGSSSFTRISGVYAIPSTAKTIKVLWYSSSIASAGVLYWGGMQFEAGSVPTQVTRNAGTIQGELAACQRYYYQASTGYYFATGTASLTTDTVFAHPLPVTMRTGPSISMSAVGDFVMIPGSKTFTSINSNTIASPTSVASYYLLGSSGLTAGYSYTLYSGTGSIKFSAEL